MCGVSRLYRTCDLSVIRIVVFSLTVLGGVVVYYSNAQYLYKPECSHGNTSRQPLSVYVTLSWKALCILTASYTSLSHTREVCVSFESLGSQI
jgi:hypothetical protein